MTLTLELPDEVMQRLQQEAATLRVPVEQLALLKLQHDFTPPDAAHDELGDAEFTPLARGVVNDYREVLERLA